MYLSQPTIGTKVFRFETVASTNDVLHELAENKLAEHGAVVITKFQSNGRGQSGNSWQSEGGDNLLLSVLITSPNTLADKQVYLNLFACLSVFDLINSYFPNRTKIKWPNDVYVDKKKIAGILIENNIQGNSIKSSIIGIGINVNQIIFDERKAISFRKLGSKITDLRNLETELITILNSRFADLMKPNHELLMNEYTNVLYQKDELAKYRSGENIFDGIITGIDESGKLKVQTSGEINLFNFKEIIFL